LDAGYQEIALTGVNSASWGEDIGIAGGILSVADAILAATSSDGRPIRRLRFNSLEPRAIAPDLVQYVANEPRLCRHFHIPLQSGSDAILKRMGRRYRSEEYAEKTRMIADSIPNAAMGADVMVGFPGETDELFAETIDFVKNLPLTYLHVFSYSPREGTPATRLCDTVPRSVKEQRSKVLRQLGETKRLAFHERYVGMVLDVLLEGSGKTTDGTVNGLTDNYIRVTVPAPGMGDNSMVGVRLTHADSEGAEGVVVNAAGNPHAATRYSSR
jgi:threonylcarbamoyladenosine tRNA methylthiotransferase MtaB